MNGSVFLILVCSIFIGIRRVYSSKAIEGAIRFFDQYTCHLNPRYDIICASFCYHSRTFKSVFELIPYTKSCEGCEFCHKLLVGLDLVSLMFLFQVNILFINAFLVKFGINLKCFIILVA